jgi:hypothetical protein
MSEEIIYPEEYKDKTIKRIEHSFLVKKEREKIQNENIKFTAGNFPGQFSSRCF